MTVMDDIQKRFADLLERVRGQKSVETGLREVVSGQTSEIKTLRQQLEAEQQQPGAWTEQDVQKIIDSLSAIEQVFDPSEVTSAVVENTPSADGGGSSGEAG